MTSKNLFFKLMKEDFKQRIWLAALISLLFFFSFPVMAMSMASRGRWETNQARWLERYTEYLAELLGVNNGWTVTLMVGFSVLCAVTGFSYLHNKSRVDFYHSIPVRREEMFLANYLNGILMMAIPYAVFLMVGVLVGNANHASAGEVLGAAGMGFLSHTVFFLLLYSVAVMAMMLTGSRVVALFGMLVLTFILPAAAYLAYGYPFIWLQSYYVADQQPRWILMLSPFTAYVDYLTRFYQLKDGIEGTWGTIAAYLAGAAAVSLAVAGLDLLLYRKRPSETAGRAMAFAVSKPIIRIPLVLLSGFAMAAFGWGMWENLGWSLFWLACGCILCHCVIEIIYHSDFKKLFSYPAQLIACMAVCVLVVCSFRFDWFGYDRYVPDSADVETASILIYGLEGDWLPARQLEERPDGMYEVDYGNSIGYVRENMRLTDPEPVVEIAREAVSQLKEKKRFDREYVTKSGGEGSTLHSSVVVEYRLKNGQKALRYYRGILLNQVMDAVDEVYDKDEYKKGSIPILSEAEAGRELSYAQAWIEGTEKEMKELKGEALRELYEAYREELSGLTMAQRKESIPVATVMFVTRDQTEAERHNRQVMESMGINTEENASWKLDGYCAGYPVYPSFQKTLGILREAGMSLELKPEDVVRMVVRYSHKDEETLTSIDRKMEVKSPEEIGQVLSLCGYADYWSMNWVKPWQEETYVELTFDRTDGEGPEDGWDVYGLDGEISYDAYEVDAAKDSEVTQTYYFPEGQVPGFIREALWK